MIILSQKDASAGRWPVGREQDISAPLFLNADIHRLNRERLILPYLTGSFHPTFIEEYAGGLLMPGQKQVDNLFLQRHVLFSLHPIREIWRPCFASLPANATPVRKETAKISTSTYDNFIQTAGIRDGAPNFSRVFKILLTPPMLLVLSLKSSKRLTYLMPSILYAALSHLMYSVGMLPVTVLVGSNTRT